MCVERMEQCEDIGALAAEVGIHRRLLYRWRDQLDQVDREEGPPPQNSRELTLRKGVSRLPQKPEPSSNGLRQSSAARRNPDVITNPLFS
jgi:transposase-like protein